ncbi:MAG: hypothetical protein HPY57_14885 [Ignavibacteria bacterium]|nr:hypothetical protein [Ignavibacteria bacterium]
MKWIKTQYTQLRTKIDYEKYIKDHWNIYTNLKFFVWSDNTWTAGFHLDVPWEKEFDKSFSENCIYDSYRAMKIKRILKE